jgi:5'-methylthioadenosine phosphorylase
MLFLPRHGRGHVHSPTTINYRANIDALKRAGATDVISVSACGSFREDLAPGTFVIVDQFIDRTHAREKSFFGKGFVAHVSMAHPSARSSPMRSSKPAARKTFRTPKAAPISRWKARNSPRWPNPISIAPGAAT